MFPQTFQLENSAVEGVSHDDMSKGPGLTLIVLTDGSVLRKLPGTAQILVPSSKVGKEFAEHC